MSAAGGRLTRKRLERAEAILSRGGRLSVAETQEIISYVRRSDEAWETIEILVGRGYGTTYTAMRDLARAARLADGEES